MKKRSVLITGAGGFVGGALATGFAELGWKVIGLDRAFERGWDQSIPRITDNLEQRVPTDTPVVDVVVHAAWVTTDPDTLGITRVEYVALNIRPLLAVLEFAARTGPTAFIFISSSGVFAPTDADDGLTEVHHPTGTAPYAAAKRAGELLVPASLGPETAVHVVRLGYLFGPGEVASSSRSRVSLVADWLAAARDGKPLEVRSDNPARDWTFTPDLAGALERVADGPAAGHAVHLASPHVYTDREFASVITTAIPGSETAIVPGVVQSKPPMVPSKIAALRDFHWTEPPAGVQALLSEAATP